MTLLEAHHLAPWEERAFRLDDLAEEGSWLVATGPGVQLFLPLTMKVDLARYEGLRISILRTDIDYRVRLHEEKP